MFRIYADVVVTSKYLFLPDIIQVREDLHRSTTRLISIGGDWNKRSMVKPCFYSIVYTAYDVKISCIEGFDIHAEQNKNLCDDFILNLKNSTSLVYSFINTFVFNITKSNAVHM